MEKTNNPAYAVLHVTSNMFATMVTNVFPPLSRPRSMSFHDWADAYDDSQKQEVVRFALLATISEQKNSGMQDPISVALRVVLFALAANANNDVVSKNLAQELFGIIENSSG